MTVVTKKISLKTKGRTDIIDITAKVQGIVDETGLKDGSVTVFVSGSTGAVSTVEYEPGLVKDLQEFFQKIIPQGPEYYHDRRWGDGNGYAHVRATLMGASLVIPVQDEVMLLGTWQQIIFIDFDNRPRQRALIVQVAGEFL
ncbi:YjbQ family protein [PVC group bacterium]|nr:YjbQ family protein [PVC group bacterium]